MGRRCQFGQGGLGHQPSPVEDDDAVDRLRYLRQDVAGDKYGTALGSQAPQQAAQPVDALGVEPVGRFVEDEDVRVAQEGSGQAEPLAHAQRELAHPAVRRLAQPDELEDLVRPGPG